MKQRIPMELQKHLKKKLFNILSYYQPDWGKALKQSELTTELAIRKYITAKMFFICALAQCSIIVEGKKRLNHCTKMCV